MEGGGCGPPVCGGGGGEGGEWEGWEGIPNGYSYKQKIHVNRLLNTVYYTLKVFIV